jgi:electron transport complex protein RnfC
LRRAIPSNADGAVEKPVWLERLPTCVCFPLSEAVNRCRLDPLVRQGDRVRFGEPLAEGPALVMHSSCAGMVESVDALAIAVRCAPGGESKPVPVGAPRKDTLADFAREAGLVGMGGSLFPSSIKFKAATQIDTLVINAVECEPGVRIDEALLLHEADDVQAGLDCLAGALGTRRTVLAVKRASAGHLAPFAARCKADMLRMNNRYPAGAEKLIVARLTGKMPPAGVLPMRLGILVISVASLWAIGRRLRRGEPVVWRPLTLTVPGSSPRNLIVPVGTPLGHLLEVYGIPFDPQTHLLVTGGLMMGAQAHQETAVTKGTNAVFVKPLTARLAKPEDPCILCGACFDVCPLGLHPSGMAERIKAGKSSVALSAQLRECFLCGACSAVCPSNIPLAQYFREARAKGVA